MFHRILIANRGEVAVRIARSCDAMGIRPVFVCSTADRNASYLNGREVVVLGPASAAQSYLDPLRLVQAAKQTHCSALHPGWGFLSESALLASLCEAHGVTFVGPSATTLGRLGAKLKAKATAQACGIPTIPGRATHLDANENLHALVDELGLPLMIKANHGGGGRGMRVVREPQELAPAIQSARREAEASFGDASIYVEALIEKARHIEVQILADHEEQVVCLGERDCSIQRQHQKLIEESPAPTLDDGQRQQLVEFSRRLAQAVGYVGAGTVEFLVNQQGEIFFMEMNARLQVEHGVSEMCTSVDLVEQQLRIAAHHPLPWSESLLPQQGHALECRINAEDPQQGFRPSPGTLSTWQLPRLKDNPSATLRVDTHVHAGFQVSPHYDSLLCKLITHAADRDGACQAMQEALRALHCEGVATTRAFHQQVLSSDAFRQHAYTTESIPGWDVAAATKV